MDFVRIGNTGVHLVKGDITSEKVDVIVNAANSGLRGGGGVDGAIHRAGGPSILIECKEIISHLGHLEAGKAVMTGGGNLPAKYVIHTVGPVWRGGKAGEAEALASCYTESLKLACLKELKTIAFPAISTGIYGYPLGAAAEIAINSVKHYLLGRVIDIQEIHFVLFDETAFRIYQEKIILIG